MTDLNDVAVLVPNVDLGPGFAAALALKRAGAIVHGSRSPLLRRGYADKVVQSLTRVDVPKGAWLEGCTRKTNTSSEETRYAVRLRDIALGLRCNFIWPVFDIDIYILSMHQEVFEWCAVSLLVPSFPIFIKSSHKYLAASLARSFFSATPFTTFVRPYRRYVTPDRPFPLVIKRPFSQGSEGVTIVDDWPSLELEFRKGELLNRPLIIQDHLDRGKPVSVYMNIASTGDVIDSFCLAKHNHLSRSFSTRCEIIELPAVEKAALSFARFLGLRGISVMQTLVMDHTGHSAAFIETNCRIGNNTRILDNMIPGYTISVFLNLAEMHCRKWRARRKLGWSPVEDLMALALWPCGKKDRSGTRIRSLIKWIKMKPAVDVFLISIVRYPLTISKYYFFVLCEVLKTGMEADRRFALARSKKPEGHVPRWRDVDEP